MLISSRSRSLRLPVVGLLALAVLLASCAGEGAQQDTSAPETSAPPAITLASIGLGEVPAPDAIDADWPKAPAGFDAERYHSMVYALRNWGQAAALSQQVREAEDPIAAVEDAISVFDITYRLTESFKEQITPRLTAASVFHPDVEAVGDPHVTWAWKRSMETDPKSGIEIVTVTLQTRAAYPVTVKDGAERVVGVIRSHSLTTGPGPRGQFGMGHSWQGFGVDECAMVLDDAFLPDDDVAAATKSLRRFAQVVTSTKVSTKPVGGGAKPIDEGLAKRCEADAA
ncbi:hypothetical protein H9L21_04095 [Aeromicrobium senzhongii]|uniref:Lipoprotein n=1 Tax=Aeromicrobium senzhongii TaxID=2663859 RepID=A0ABX6SVA9_9ACTN|nr:hypothetical protein [Aeromicrobium senzhongii]MTB87848.1 hypothetical protein [Aeromicrobium senzhongii]QNL95132.1 hypothetical protein H9L21_04095 [Aeromicrobium senzhongii]